MTLTNDQAFIAELRDWHLAANRDPHDLMQQAADRIEELRRIIDERRPSVESDAEILDAVGFELCTAGDTRGDALHAIAAKLSNEPTPTAWAYQQACRALELWRVRARDAEAMATETVWYLQRALHECINRAANPEEVRRVCRNALANTPTA